MPIRKRPIAVFARMKAPEAFELMCRHHKAAPFDRVDCAELRDYAAPGELSQSSRFPEGLAPSDEKLLALSTRLRALGKYTLGFQQGGMPEERVPSREQTTPDVMHRKPMSVGREIGLATCPPARIQRG